MNTSDLARMVALKLKISFKDYTPSVRFYNIGPFTVSSRSICFTWGHDQWLYWFGSRELIRCKTTDVL